MKLLAFRQGRYPHLTDRDNVGSHQFAASNYDPAKLEPTEVEQSTSLQTRAPLQ